MKIVSHLVPTLYVKLVDPEDGFFIVVRAILQQK